MFEFVRATANAGPRVIVDRHLYLTEDKSRVVEEGDPAGRTLWATPGMEVAEADAVRLGAVAADSAEAEPADDGQTEPEAADDAAGVKERTPAENKQQRKPASKRQS